MIVALGMMLAPLWAATPATGEEKPRPVRVTKEAWYSSSTKDSLPPILVNEVPPGVVCLVAPEFCSDDARVLTEPIEKVLKDAEFPQSPVHPVAPNTLPAGLLGGHRRYASLMEFEIPPAPADALVERFDLVMHESGINYAMESPGFRAFVRAVVAQAADSPSQDPFRRFLEGVASGDISLAETEPTGIEVCAIVEPWKAGENRDMEKLPEADCAFGANGVRNDDGTWTFDLSTVVQAWIDGTIENHGIYFGPMAASNLEYGDPDLSANFQISLAGGEASDDERPRAAVSYSTAPPASSGSGSSGGMAFGPTSPGSPMGGGSAAGPSFGGGAPVVAPPSDRGPIVGGAESAPVPVASGSPYVPAWMWGLIPIGLAGMAAYWHAIGMTAAAATRAPGALSRLVGTPEP